MEKIDKAAILGSNNRIYTGYAHAHILTQEPKGVLRCCPQGFITTTGRFVDRVEGLAIAEREGQIIHKHPPFDELLSEDLRERVRE
jgi:hypothetical protein